MWVIRFMHGATELRQLVSNCEEKMDTEETEQNKRTRAKTFGPNKEFNLISLQ